MKLNDPTALWLEHTMQWDLLFFQQLFNLEKTFGVQSVYMYLLVGSEKALLIDSGYGMLDIPKVVGEITDKPVICACTHGHLDHAPGAYQFETAYLHRADFETYRSHSSGEFARAFLLGSKAKSDRVELVERMAEKQYPELLNLEDIPVFDLGGRTVSWTPVPGHTPGSVVFLDEQNHCVFDGDAATPGVWLFLPESLPMQSYVNSITSYVDYLKQNQVRFRYGGHMAKPLKLEHTEKLALCAQYCAKHPNAGIPVHFPFADTKVVFSQRQYDFHKTGSKVRFHPWQKSRQVL